MAMFKIALASQTFFVYREFPWKLLPSTPASQVFPQTKHYSSLEAPSQLQTKALGSLGTELASGDAWQGRKQRDLEAGLGRAPSARAEQTQQGGLGQKQPDGS